MKEWHIKEEDENHLYELLKKKFDGFRVEERLQGDDRHLRVVTKRYVGEIPIMEVDSFLVYFDG